MWLLLIKIIAIQLRLKRISIIVDATLTSFSISKRKITEIIKNDVIRIDRMGVPVFGFTRWKNPGRRLSSAIARGVLEAAIIPAFAVVINAVTAAMDSNRYPINPVDFAAPSEIGMSDEENSLTVKIPAVLTNVTKYRTVTTENAENMPLGIVLPGFLISSAIEAIFVNPP